MSFRVIPCLLLSEGRLVKTVQFRQPRYIGDPVNTVRIFNELEVDELCFLDIRASLHGTQPDYALLQQISDECFMPLSYGGGIDSVERAQKVLACGFEKVVINTAAVRDPELVSRLAERFGSQSVIVAIDVVKNFFGRYHIAYLSATEKGTADPVSWAQQMQEAGAGELLLTAVSQEGTWKGFDLPLIREVSRQVDIPVIAHGGGGSIPHVAGVAQQTAATAVALGSMLVYQQKNKGILINYPGDQLKTALPTTRTP